MSKPAVKQRPRAPTYPRRVPQFDVEELPPAPEDLAWNALKGGNYYSSDLENATDEVATEQRAAKRRRIEACATAYLRGEPLYIMSAQLKGPFKEGWRNPWAKRSKRRTVEAVADARQAEVPETSKKVLSTFAQEEPLIVPVATPISRPASCESEQHEIGPKSITVDHAPSPFTSKVQNLPTEPSPKVPKQAKERRVEEWLRTNDAFAKSSEVLVHSSPTPTTRRHRTPRHSQDPGRAQRASQSEPPRIAPPVVRSPKSATSFQAGDSRRLSKTEGLIHELSRNIQNIVAEPNPQPADALHAEVRKLAHPASSSKSLQDKSRAEFEILKHRRSALQTAPADAHMSPFEFRRVPTKANYVEDSFGPVNNNVGDVVSNAKAASDLSTVPPQQPQFNAQMKKPPTPNVDQSKHAANQIEGSAIASPKLQLDNDDHIAAHPGEQSGAIPKGQGEGQHVESVVTKASKPALSTAVSDVSTADMLPSAQPRLELVRSLSGALRDDKMLSMKQIATGWDNRDGQEGHQQDAPATKAALGGVDVPEAVCQDQQDDQRNDNVTTSTPIPANRAAELNTQEMLANIEPLDMSTIKKPKDSTRRDTPQTATKVRSDKKRKKASFAIEPSSTPSFPSIQDVMKAKVSKKLGSPPLFVLGKEDLTVVISDEENETPHKRSRRISNASKPKSILKSTNLVSSPHSLRRSKSGLSTGQEQDAQQGPVIPIGSGQNAIGEETFDLDAAIDDLGSFLGTWDPDKEASGLDIEL